MSDRLINHIRRPLAGLLLSFFITLPSIMYGQTDEQADEWFEAGLKAFQNANFHDAIRYFEYIQKEYEGQENLDKNYGSFLNLLALSYSNIGDKAKALALGKRALELISENLGNNNSEYATSLSIIANCYSEFGENEKALELENQAITIYKATLGEKNINYAVSLSNLARYYGDLGNYKKAIELEKRYLRIIEEIGPAEQLNDVLISSLSLIARYYSLLNDYAKAVEFESQSLEIKKKSIGEKSLEYASSLKSLASYYYELGKYAKAIELCSTAVEINRELVGEKNSDYVNSLYDLASYYNSFGDYTKAIELASKVLDIEKETIGENNSNYANSLNNLSVYYSKAGNFIKAKELETKALMILRETVGENNSDYATSLSNLANEYDNLGDYSKSLELLERVLVIEKETLGEKHSSYATTLNNLATIYSHIGEYSKALEIGEKALEIYRGTLGEKHPDFANCLHNLANLYSYLGDNTKAKEILIQALEIYGKIVDDKSLGYFSTGYLSTLGSLATTYYDLADYSSAIELGNKVLEVTKEAYGENHPDCARLLNNLASYYSALGDYAKAVELRTQALEIRKEVLGENHPDYAISLGNLGSDYSSLGDYSKAIELEKQTLEIQEKVLGVNHPEYAISLDNLAFLYINTGDILNAIDCQQQSLETFYSHIVHQFSGLAGSKRSLYWSKYKYIFTDIYPSNIFYFFTHQIHKSNETNYSMKFFVGLVLILFSLLVISWILYNHYTGQKIVKWKYMLAFSCILLGGLLIVLDRTKGNADGSSQEAMHLPISDLYDKSALFAKGLLLTTEIEMNKLIQESGDEEALSMFEELKQKRLMLQKLYEKPIAERILNTDSLEQEADKLESELVKRSQVYGDFSRKLRATWKDVQAALDEDEMAVEFLSFGNKLLGDSTMVVALTLRKDDKEPKMIPLFEQKQMEKVKDVKISRDRSVRKTKTFYSQEVTDLVWKPMAEELKGIKRIYFSAAGILHKVGIEYAPGMEGYDIYRLSTTREVIDMKEKGEKDLNAQSDAVLYGGVDYGALAKPKAQKEETRKNQKDEENAHRSISIDLHHTFIDSLKVRGTDLKYLPGTLDEVKHISSCFEQKHLKAIIGTDATETSVKSLPENLPKILHIATHGFYYTESEKKRMDARKDLRMLDERDKRGQQEDEALNRSGLFMAGANRALKGEELPMEADDGILTAQEIAKIDLRGVDLVVLSACETGQGDINQGEGVYGLQRGFKKAGVQTILMSLWKVSDKATEILMTEFYKQVCAGLSKRAALRMAQKKVREYKNPEGKLLFEDPFFWAGFILLD